MSTAMQISARPTGVTQDARAGSVEPEHTQPRVAGATLQRSSLSRNPTTLHRRFSSDQNLTLTATHPAATSASPLSPGAGGGAADRAALAAAVAAAAAAAGGAAGGAGRASGATSSLIDSSSTLQSGAPLAHHDGQSFLSGHLGTPTPGTAAAEFYAAHTGDSGDIVHQTPSSTGEEDTVTLPYHDAIGSYGPSDSPPNTHEQHAQGPQSDAVTETNPSAPPAGAAGGAVAPSAASFGGPAATSTFTGLQTVTEQPSQELLSGHLSRKTSGVSREHLSGIANDASISGLSPTSESVEASRSSLEDPTGFVTLSVTRAAAQHKSTATAAAAAARLHAHVQAQRQQQQSGVTLNGPAGAAGTARSTEGSATLRLSFSGSNGASSVAPSSTFTAPFPGVPDRTSSFVVTGGVSSSLRGENAANSNKNALNSNAHQQQQHQQQMPGSHRPSATFSDEANSVTEMMLLEEGAQAKHAQHAEQPCAEVSGGVLGEGGEETNTFTPVDTTVGGVGSHDSSTAGSSAQQGTSHRSSAGIVREESLVHGGHVSERAGFLLPAQPMASPVITMTTCAPPVLLWLLLYRSSTKLVPPKILYRNLDIAFTHQCQELVLARISQHVVPPCSMQTIGPHMYDWQQCAILFEFLYFIPRNHTQQT